MSKPTVPFRLILICDRDAAQRKGRSLREATGAALDALDDDAPVAFMVRDKSERTDSELASWAAPLVQRCNDMGGPKVIVHTRTALAQDIGAHAVHFADGTDAPGHVPGKLIGQSVHAHTQASAAADYSLLAPIFIPISKRAATPALGLTALQARARATPAPLFALGGITLDNAASCIAHGAHGVALLGGWLFADDPGAHVRALVTTLNPATT